MDDRAIAGPCRNAHRLEGIAFALVLSTAFWSTTAVTVVAFVGPLLR